MFNYGKDPACEYYNYCVLSRFRNSEIFKMFFKNIFAVRSPDFSILAKWHLHGKLIAKTCLLEYFSMPNPYSGSKIELKY